MTRSTGLPRQERRAGQPVIWTDAALKQSAALDEVQKNRQALRYVLQATPELHRMQPLSELLPFVLEHVIGLLGAANAFLVVLPEGEPMPETALPDGFVAMVADNSDLVIQAGTGRFASSAHLNTALSADELSRVLDAIRQGEAVSAAGSTIVPLRAGDTTIGTIYLEHAMASTQDLDLLQILANQAAVAIQNVRLYEMAAMDPLTGVQARRFFETWIRKELHSAFRSPQPTSLLMIDVDHLKEINDKAGHLGGDQALRRVGEALRGAIRDSDVAGRYGGDEFSIILPSTDLVGAGQVGARILAALANERVSGPGFDVPVRCSIGLCTLAGRVLDGAEVALPLSPAYFRAVADALIGSADVALYEAKRQGGGQLQCGEPVTWPEPPG
jgi:diguanylate cyclase (GGDEF)-like protein